MTLAARFAPDASALLCLLNDETGAERVAAVLDDAIIPSVNLSEVIAKIIDRGGPPDMATAILDPLRLRVIDFDCPQAVRAGSLRAATRAAGLSFGDRACLALAGSHRLSALTADRAWASLDLGVPITLIR